MEPYRLFSSYGFVCALKFWPELCFNEGSFLGYVLNDLQSPFRPARVMRALWHVDVSPKCRSCHIGVIYRDGCLPAVSQTALTSQRTVV